MFAGRDAEIEEFKLALFEGVGSPYRALLISGPRGSGKTVLLNQLESTAKESGWVVVRAYANDTLLDDLKESQIPAVESKLDYVKKSGARISGLSVAGLGSVSTEVHSPKVRHTLISRLHALFDSIAGKAGGVLITIDELQSAPIKQIAEVAVAVQDLMRDGYDIAFVGAGLTFGVENLLEEPGTTFLRRAMRVELGPVADEEVMDSFAATAAAAGKSVTDQAQHRAASLIKGYPYILQLVGSKAWALSEIRQSQVIEESDIISVREPVISQMGQQIHKIALRNVPGSERDYLVAMASVASRTGLPVDTAAVAEQLGKTQGQVSRARSKLVERDLVFSPKYGTLDFRLPVLRRVPAWGIVRLPGALLGLGLGSGPGHCPAVLLHELARGQGVEVGAQVRQCEAN